jgi:hypothetical protein
MALFMHTQDRKREPLGGREAKGFGDWLNETHQEVSETYAVLQESLPLGHASRYLAQSAHRDYAGWVHLWKLLQLGKSPSVIDEWARDDFEVKLIANVMSSYGALRYAQDINLERVQRNGRPMLDVVGEYERACLLLSRYLGIHRDCVVECNGRQDKLMALGAGR